MTRAHAIIALCLIGASSLSARAAPQNVGRTDGDRGTITIAVIEFDSNVPSPADIGRQISAATAKSIATRKGFKVVAHDRVRDAMTAMKLSASAAVDTKVARQVGRAVSAHVVVVGRAVPNGKKVLVNAKLIATDSGRIKAVAVRRGSGKIVKRAAVSVARRLAEVAVDLVPGDAPQKTLEALKRALADREQSRIAILIYEDSGDARFVLTRMAQDEFTRTMLAAGLNVIPVNRRALNRWAKSAQSGAITIWPQGLAGVDVAIVGHGVAAADEAARRVVDCTATLDVVMVDRQGHRATFKHRATGNARAETRSAATRQALTRSARAAGINVLDHLVKTLPKKSTKRIEK